MTSSENENFLSTKNNKNKKTEGDENENKANETGKKYEKKELSRNLAFFYLVEAANREKERLEKEGKWLNRDKKTTSQIPNLKSTGKNIDIKVNIKKGQLIADQKKTDIKDLQSLDLGNKNNEIPDQKSLSKDSERKKCEPKKQQQKDKKGIFWEENGKTFTMIFGYKVQIEHKKKTYFCNKKDCEYSCISLSKMVRHTTMHTGEKTFKCIMEQCTKVFNRKDNMMSHYRNFCKFNDQRIYKKKGEIEEEKNNSDEKE